MVNCYNRVKIFYPTRRQQVCVKGCFSDWVDRFSGVLHGSVLSPILFLAYINDLPNSVLSTLYICLLMIPGFIMLLKLTTIVTFYKTWITSQTGVEHG